MTRNPVFAPTVIRWGAVTLLSLSFLALASRAASASATDGADVDRPAVRADAPARPAPPTPPVIDGRPVAPAPAAEPPAPADRPTPRPPRPPRAPAMPEMPVFPGMMAGPMGPLSTSMAATDQYVYVLRGNTLYAFDAKTLRQTGSVNLEPPRTPPGDREPRRDREIRPGLPGEPVAPALPLRPEQPEALPAIPEGGRGLGGPRGFRGFGPEGLRGGGFPQGPGALGRGGLGGFRAFGGGEPGIFGRGLDGGRPEGFFPMLGGLPAPPTSMTATPQYVYVLRGNTLYSFDARTLRQVGRTTIQPPRPRSDDRAPAPPAENR